MARLARIYPPTAVLVALLLLQGAVAQPAAGSEGHKYAVEDMTSASLATSQLRPDPPQLEESNEEANFISEWVTVRWRPGDPIYLYVVRPKGVKKAPVVIYLYDYPAETDIFRDEDWCQRATAGGYAAIGFVPALNGQRYHDRPIKEWFVSEMQEALAESAHDVQMVLNYLAKRGDVEAHHVAVFGVGQGATIAVMAAAVDPRIKAIDLVDPWGDWPVWLANSKLVGDEERPAYTKAEFLKKIADFDPVELLPQLETARLRFTPMSDGATPKEAQERIAGALPPRAERGRLVSSEQFDVTGASSGHVFEWIKEQLRSVPAGRALEKRK